MKKTRAKPVEELVAALAFAADTQDKKRPWHSWRIAMLAALISKKFPAREQKDIFYAGLLHNTGSVGLPRRRAGITGKTIFHPFLAHPITAASLALKIPGMRKAARLILDHRECLNGSGFPRAKSKKEIPAGAQVIRIAERIDLLLRQRRGITFRALKKELAKNTGREYSYKIYKEGLKAIKEKGILKKISFPEKTPLIFRRVSAGIAPACRFSGEKTLGKALRAAAEFADMKHPSGSGHSLRVARYAAAVAREMKLKKKEIILIEQAALLHEIGKISINYALLDKRKKLNKGEFSRIKAYPLYNEKIAGLAPSLRNLGKIIGAHCENFDGSGYPRMLQIKDIPLAARIIAICCAFDAMTSPRPYRKAFSGKDACRLIKKLAGKKFDPQVVKTAIPLFKKTSA